MMLSRGLFLSMSLLFLNACNAAPQFDISINVTDDDGMPVEGVKIQGVFDPFTKSYKQGRKSRAVSNEKGEANISGPSYAPVEIKFTKDGHYETNIFLQRKHEVKKYVVNALLREKRNPIAMYAADYVFSHNKKLLIMPEVGQKLGFDFFENDWVLPGYQGINEDIYFEAIFTKAPGKTLFDDLPFQDTLKIDFPNSGDGIQKARLDKDWKYSDYKMAYEAPQTDYLHSLKTIYARALSEEGRYENIRMNNENKFYLRIRSEQDDKGNIIKAHYCKIVDGFQAKEKRHKKKLTGEVYLTFAYYCNPTINDRNVEFDTKRNLSQNLNKGQGVRKP